MAEETPGNLGAFGGFTAGRAVDDNRGIDRATDRLEKEIDRLADSLERLTSGLGSAQRASGGGMPATKQSAHGNGGAVTFSGVAAHSSGQPSFSVAQTGGAYRSQSPTAVMPESTGRVVKGMAVGAAAGAAMYAAGHYKSQAYGQTIAAMGTAEGGGGWFRGYSNMMGNYTAHGGADNWAMNAMLVQRGGYAADSKGFAAARSNIISSSAVNPNISNVQSAQASMALGTTTTFNRMARVGINPLGAAGRGDPRQVARALLGKMGTSRVKTKANVFAAFAPNGSATVTLDSYVAAGYLPPESRDVVESEMRNILLAQIRGTEAAEYSRLANLANGSGQKNEDARETLAGMGITTETLIQKKQQLEGARRESEVHTIKGFDWGLRRTTDALTGFRKALNSILSIPGVGESVGLFGGVTGTAPVIGSLLNRMPGGGAISGMFSGLGDGPSSMAGSQMSYGAASGAASARAGFGTAASRSVASTGSAAKMSGYSLGPVKPWVAKAASILGPMFGISSIGGVAQRSTPSDHPTGHALDFMCGKSQGDRLAAYAVSNARKLNISYVIWRQRIWNVAQPGWRMMEDRGDPTQNHMDHVHVSFLHSPTNGDFSGMPSGGVGGGRGGLNAVGASSPDNGAAAGFTGGGTGYSLGGKFSEVAALGITAGGGAGSAMGMSATVGGGGSGLRGATTSRSGGRGTDVSGLSGYGSGAAGSVRTGTLNVGSLKGATNPTGDVERLLGKADVLSLTETNPQRIAALRRGLADNNWGVYAGDGSATGRYAQDASIVYDKSKYELVKGGTYKLGDLTGNFLGGKGKRFANYALLKDKSTGMSFWQVSAHTVPMANADKAHRRMHKEQFDSLDDLAEMLQKTGIPVIMGGDFNQQRDRDFWRNPSGMTSARGGGVDHVFGQSGMVKTSDLSMVGGMSGDHSGAVLTTMSVKGTGGGNARGGNGGSVSQNIALGKALAASRGWTGPQWNALKQLWMRESGWRTDADNPTSSAYGIPQALTQLHGLGQDYMTDPRNQIQWGLNYIAGRYGTPSAAWNFWQKNNYYKQGAWKIREDKEAQIHMGEMIVPSKIADVIRDELAAPGIRGALGSSRGNGRGEVKVVFQDGAIRVSLASGDEAEARQASKWVVDAMMEDERFKSLAEG